MISGGRSRLVFLALGILLAASLAAAGRSAAARQEPPRGESAWAGKDPTIDLPLVAKNSSPGALSGWTTVAGGPQRTSWTAEQVSGNLQVAWYRPIQAYIPQNVQLIAWNGLIYVSTARGLYALDAGTGAVAWRYDSDMPMGNSPTVVNGVLYVAGFDRKVHALDAMTGTPIWEFSGAQAGYDTNPLVVEGKVILGNHDGNLYALDARSGQLLWKFQAGGPIRLTAAYLNGVVFFAAEDQVAYAVTTAGALKWKSQPLPGDGIQSYWPVVARDPVTQKDLVVFSGSPAYRFDTGPGSLSVLCSSYTAGDPPVPCDSIRFYTDYIFFDKPAAGTTPVGPVVQINEPWASGKTVLDSSRIAELYENNPQPDPHLHKPWLRSYFVLNAADGTELTYDSDHTGYPEYAPIVAFGTNSGSAYPPVSEPDGLLYFNNLWTRDNQGKVMGWRIGTPYVTLEGAQGDTGEPQSISGGGSLIYRAICCDRAGDWFDLNDLTTKGLAWFYNTPLTDQAPGYDQMWWFIDPTILDRLTGTYGTKNGIYNNHGDQNPIVPYNGMLFSHRSNAVIAYGPAPGPGKLPLLTASSPPAAAMTTPSTADLTGRLDAEIQKMIAAGRLRPGYYNAGQFNIYPDLVDYFANPGDTLYTLAAAYPLVSPSLQPQLRDYLHMEFSRYFDPTMVANTGWADGAAREAYALPPEVTADLANYPQQLTAGTAWSWQYPQVNFYAMWKFEQVFPEEAGNVYQLAKSVLEVPVPALATDSYLSLKPWELNGYIDGYFGFLRLQEAAGQGSADAVLRAQVTAELQRLELLRASTFSKDTPYVTYDQGYTHRTLNVARNFIMLTPDLGNYLRSTVLSKVQAAISEYNDVGPYWFVARYTAAIGEGGTQNLYDYNSMFLAKAYILKQSRADLTRYLDVPGFARGDLLYIQDLIAALQAS